MIGLIKANLTRKQARAVILRYERDYTNEEIAREMGVKKESVSRYICIGLKQIQQLLADEGDYQNE